MIKLYVLGFPRIEIDGQPFKIDRKKALALLVYLAMEQRACSRETLATLFWGEYDQSRAFAYLRRELWTLSSELGENFLNSDRETVQLAETPWVDALEFQKRIGDSEWAAAVDVYTDRFLAGFTLRDCPAFDDWQYLMAEQLQQSVLAALNQVTTLYESQQRPQEGITYSQRWLALDPLDEAAHRQLMKFYALVGQRSAAIRQYETCVRLLREQLDSDPQPETTRFYESLQQPVLIRRLPPQMTPFVGREKELAEILHLLENPACRLLTLVGTGGIGKTRLAIEAGKQVGTPVYFVSLVATSSPDLLLPTLVDALELTFDKKQDQKKQFFTYLSDKAWLLILDNFEHLQAGAGLLNELLEAAPLIRLLVTSRERLNLVPEWVLPVEGMAHDSAVQLFIQQAQKIGTVPTDKQAVADICQLVDRMPLAIELAATWTKVLSCAEIASEIQHNLDFLTSSLRDTPERHRSLRAVFEHSWAQLTDTEQEIFRKLSIFRGEFQREAAAQIIPATLLQLSALVDKSLLRRTENGGYEIHEMLRQYAAEKLAAHPAEGEALNARFSAYFLNLVRLREKHMIGYNQKQVLRELGREIENIRAAWHWAAENGDWGKIFNALGLLEFFDIRGLPVEAEELFGAALNHLKAAQTLTPQMEMILGRVLAGYAWFGTWLGYIGREDARQLLEESIALSEKYGNKKELAFGYLALGHNYQFGYDMEKAEALYHRSYALYLELGDLYWIGNVLGALAMIADLRGEYTASFSLYQEMLQIDRRIGETVGCAGALISMTNVARLQGNFEDARTYAEEGVMLYRDLTQPDRLSNALANLSLVYKALGIYDAAEAALEESRHLCESLKFDKGLLAALLNNMGILARLRGRYEEAARIHQQSISLFKEVNSLWGLGFSQNDLGSALLALERPFDALRLHEDSLRICRQMGNRYDTADSLQRMGQVYATIGQPEKAEACLKEALQIAYEIHVVPLMAEILTHIGLLDRSPELLSAAYYASGTEAHIRQRIAALGLNLPAPTHALVETVRRVCESAVTTP